MKKVTLFALSLCLFISVLFAQGGRENTVKEASSWPTKSINLIIPWNPGDGTDLAARAYAQALQNVTGQPVVAINKPGASGSVGTMFAAQQVPDGYNILFSAETPGTFQVMGVSDVAFEKFDGISMMCEDTKVIVVKGDSKYTTIQALIADIKENPGKVRLAYSAPGASGHIQGLLFQAMGLNVAMTPFGGGAAGLTAVMGGQVDFTFANGATIMGHVAAGNLRALALFTDKENPAFPGVPAFTNVMPESQKYLPFGFPYSVLVPKGTDSIVINQIVEATKKAVEDKAWKDFLAARPTYKTLYEFGPEAVNSYWSRFMSIADWLLYDAGVAKYSPDKFGIKRL